MDPVFDLAISDFAAGRQQGPLLIHNRYGHPDEMPLDVYFRKNGQLSEPEAFALSLCRGQVLDVGAGAGALSLILQAEGHRITALEHSPACCRIMRQRGIRQVWERDFFAPPAGRFDTLLLMMNGLGLCGTLEKLPGLLRHLAAWLKPGGQVLFDSSDIAYLYEDREKPDHYYGEMTYRYEYRGRMGPWFKWLYVDSDILRKATANSPFRLQVLAQDDSSHYLGRLTFR